MYPIFPPGDAEVGPLFDIRRSAGPNTCPELEELDDDELLELDELEDELDDEELLELVEVEELGHEKSGKSTDSAE